MKTEIHKIRRLHLYGNECNREAEPKVEDVIKAVSEDRLEPRNFQLDKDELALEWYQQHPQGCVQLATKYHAERIAFFWVRGWPEEYPLEICVHYVLEDGGHRLMAA